MKVTVVCEHNPSMDSEEGMRAYPEGFANALAGIFRGLDAEAVLLRADEQGVHCLTDEILGKTDVMVWWGHWYHTAVDSELVEKIAYRVQCGMGMIFLHSAHDSKPFKRLLGTSCSLSWREDGKKELFWCVDPTHPIARGLGEYIEIPQEEMYGEPFDIPVPDELVYVGWFTGGEVLRGGCVFHRGRGKIFYFNPGHETYPTYKLEKVRQLLSQACEYVAPKDGIAENMFCRHIEKSILKQ